MCGTTGSEIDLGVVEVDHKVVEVMVADPVEIEEGMMLLKRRNQAMRSKYYMYIDVYVVHTVLCVHDVYTVLCVNVVYRPT